MFKQMRRRGFTLPEVLVTITIVAVLAAVVVPAVVNQVSKGDTAGLAGDTDALRGAISNFITDTRHYPASITDLTVKPSSSDLDLMGTAYGTAAIAAWKGPYFPTNQSIGTSATGSYTSQAYSLVINSAFEAPAAGNNNYITLVFSSSPTAADIATIDRLFDAGAGDVPVPGCGTSHSTGYNTGAIRWTETTGVACAISALKWRLVSAG